METFKQDLAATGLSLRPHQEIGVKTILGWRESHHGGIVADDMGLGKTCQAVASMCVLAETEKCRPHLVICPLSVVDHWEREIKRFGTGKLNVVKYMGNAEQRLELLKKMENTDWNVMLTTYQYIMRDAEHFGSRQKWHWASLIFDEAHRLKSMKSQLHEIIREMPIDWIVLMTGTPVQNNIKELYSLLCLVDKKQFPLEKADDFVEDYKNTDDEKVAEKLRNLLSSYLLRRTKEIVAIEIPSSMQVVLYHGLTEIQKKLYRAILSKNYRFFESLEGNGSDYSSANKTSLINVMMQLRKCASHPYLFQGVEPEPFEEGEHLVEASGKFALLDRLLCVLKAKGHRVLIFSQMTRVLDVVQDFLTYRGFTYERLDGSVRAEERFAAIGNFEKGDSAVFCFLLSTRAGGVGLNLTAADSVIFLDSDFNPQNDLQAAARCHRIGQTKPVKIIRLIAQHTVEEVILNRATRKLRMTRQVLGTDSECEKENLTAAEISNMILSGLGKLNEAESSNSENRMSDEMIENIVGETDEFGQWKLNGDGEPNAAEDQENDRVKNEHVDDKAIEDMYMFEGQDYKKDRRILEEIVAEGRQQKLSTSDRTLNKSLDVEQRPARARKPLTKEQIEARQKKRAETLRKKKQMEIDAMNRKEREKEERKARKWETNGYVSTVLPLPAENEEDSDDESNGHCGPYFVIGDVTKPKKNRWDKSNHALIVHVVDNGGSFGRGGVFSALRAKSQRVVDAYELAGRMDDLHISDAHIIEEVAESEAPAENEDSPRGLDLAGDDEESRCISGEPGPSSVTGVTAKRKESVVLLVAQHCRRRDEIRQDVLAKCFSRIAEYAKTKGPVSVHMPRIGYGMRKVQWYTVERIIRKHLTAKGIPVYIYYFKRKVSSALNDRRNRGGAAIDGRSPRKRKAPSSTCRIADADDVDYSENMESEEEEEEEDDYSEELSDEDEVVYDDAPSDEEEKGHSAKRSRYCSGPALSNLKIWVNSLDADDLCRYSDIIEALNGEPITELDSVDDVTHALIDDSVSVDEITRLKGRLPKNCTFVKKEWIDKCADAGTLVDLKSYVV